jgi:dephospho-CoA kinase
MLTVGLTGGLASGKSHVGRHLAELGCLLIKADELGHMVLSPGGEAYEDTIRAFGPEILNADGTIDRRKLAAQVFQDPDRLALLNSFVHPHVRSRTQAALEEFARTAPDGIAVVEAAILIETGSYRSYDRLIVVVCTDEQQIARAMDRDGITREEALARLRRQLPLSEKVKYADYVIDTSGSRENTAKQTHAVYEALRSKRA